MTWYERLERIDRRWIFLVLGAILVFGFIASDFVLQFSAVEPTKPVVAFYERIEAIPEGATVLLSVDYDPGSVGELYPQHVAVLHQLFRRNIKIISFTLWEAGPPMIDRAFNEVAPQYNKEYGVDYVNLGFKAGREINMPLLGESIPDTLPVDARGTPVAEIPVMQNIKNYSSLALLISVSAGYPGTKEWVQQVPNRFGIEMISGCAAVSAPEYRPYLDTGQLKGMITGQVGAAEYEALVKPPPTPMSARRAVGGQLTGHVFMVFAILLGNVLYLLGWLRRRREGVA